MATLSVESDSLRTNAEKIIKLAGRMNGIHNRFVRVRRTLDWDVMGEAQLESKISHLLSELDSLSKKLNEAGTVLQDIENEYTAAHNEMKEAVCELPDSVNQLSSVGGSEAGTPGMSATRLANTDFLRIVDDQNITYYGGNQDWFERCTQDYGGCGPTAAANLLAYMAMTDPELAKLYGYDINNITKEDFAKFMEEAYKKVKPIEIPVINSISDKEGKVIKIPIKIPVSIPPGGIPIFYIEDEVDLPPSFGVPSSIFVNGVKEFAQEKGISLEHEIISLKPSLSGEKPNFENAVSFIREGLKKDKPIALLNVLNPVDMRYIDSSNNTSAETFERHWVIITGMEEDKNTGEVTLEVSTWGGRATLSFNDLYNNIDWNEAFLPVDMIYFEHIK